MTRWPTAAPWRSLGAAGGSVGTVSAPLTTSAKSTSTAPVSTRESWFTSLAVTVTVHRPASGASRKTFSTVSTVFATPPAVLVLPAFSPTLPR